MHREPSISAGLLERLATALVALPILVFYALLAKAAVNLPFLDDYPSVLEFLNVHLQLTTAGARTAHLLTAQHNEYKLLFENCVFLIDRALFGHVNFILLSALGNAFVLLLFLVIWQVALPSIEPQRKALLMVPPAFLLFQLQYASTLDWAMGSLQNLPVLFFALVALWQITSEGGYAFPVSCAAMLLCIASSGNGFILALSGALFLLQKRAWQRLFGWVVTAGLAAGWYAYRYNFHASTPKDAAGHPHASLIGRIAYMLGFLGASAAGTTAMLPAIGLGLLLCAGLVIAWRKQAHRHNPALFYFSLFLVMSAAGVSLLRGNEELQQSLTSRYRIYSNLGLICAYLLVLEELPRSRARAVRAVVSVSIGLSMLFWAASDYAGFRFLKARSDEITREMRIFEYPSLAGSAAPAPASAIQQKHRAEGLYNPVPAVLHESERLGVYWPPDLH
jgi:hypothetical protein